MNEKEWTSKLRERMADYEEAAPENLWGRIEGALSEKHSDIAETVPVKKAKVMSWRWWAATAAVTLLLITGGGLLYKYAREETRNVEQLARQNTKGKGGESAPVLSQVMPEPISKESFVLNGTEESKDTVTEQVKEESLRDNVLEEKPADTRSDDSEEQREQQRRVQAMPAASPRSSMSDSRDYMSHRRKSSGPSVTLFAQNMMGGDDMRHDPVMMNAATAAKYENAYMQGNSLSTRRATGYLYNFEEITKHHQPVTLGLSVSYPLNSRLSLLSGITYTKQSSDFIQKMNNSRVVNEQQLYYVGVPLRVRYQLMSWKGFTLYGTAGGAVDFNVKATYTTEGAKSPGKKDHMMFSVDAAAGVQYHILPQIGVFVEPGVKYYFDNKSGVENYFKEHPVRFNLQMGVRFEMNKR
jgi:opacity protein-like surface antigen